MEEGKLKDKDRERYVIGRKLVCSVHEFDSGKDYSDENRGKNTHRAKVVMKMTCPACPVQYEGKINGFAAYYRSRHAEWRLEIYSGKIFDTPILFEKHGDDGEDTGFPGMLLAEERILEGALEFAAENWKEKKNV